MPGVLRLCFMPPSELLGICQQTHTVINEQWALDEDVAPRFKFEKKKKNENMKNV